MIGIGTKKNLIIVMTDVIYPKVNDVLDLNGKPSLTNLPRKKNSTSIDTRKVPSGIMASFLPAVKKYKLLTEYLNVIPNNKKPNYLQILLEKSLKENDLWIAETNADLAGRTKTDIIKLYETVL